MSDFGTVTCVWARAGLDNGLTGLTLVGQDIGGMVVYSYLRAYRDITRAVILDVVVPGGDPWEEVLRNPYIWL